MSENEICKGYCGVACIDGSCPIANRDKYAERGYDVVHKCSECIYYKGCEDCCFDGDAQYCPKFTNDNKKEIEGGSRE